MNTQLAHIIAFAVLSVCPVHADNAVSGAPKKWDDDPKGVQVFILAGQSNMVGHGKADDGHGDVKGAIGSLRYQAANDTKNTSSLH